MMQEQVLDVCLIVQEQRSGGLVLGHLMFVLSQNAQMDKSKEIKDVVLKEMEQVGVHQKLKNMILISIFLLQKLQFCQVRHFRVP